MYKNNEKHSDFKALIFKYFFVSLKSIFGFNRFPLFIFRTCHFCMMYLVKVLIVLVNDVLLLC